MNLQHKCQLQRESVLCHGSVPSACFYDIWDELMQYISLELPLKGALRLLLRKDDTSSFLEKELQQLGKKWIIIMEHLK